MTTLPRAAGHRIVVAVSVVAACVGLLSYHAFAGAALPDRTTTTQAKTQAAPKTQFEIAVDAQLVHAHAPTQLLVRYTRGLNEQTMAAVNTRAGANRVLRRYRVDKELCLVEVPAGGLRAALLTYNNDPSVDYAEPDYVVRATAIPNENAALFNRLWGLRNVGQPIQGTPGTAGADIQVETAWDLWTGDPDFRIAVIDTGIRYSHPDLAANMWTNPGEIPNNGIDDDGNTYVDDVHGYDFANDDGDPNDDNSHGTHVAGTIGAVANNGIGVVGVNWQCSLVALKFLGADGTGFTSDAIKAMNYCIVNNIRVSNNSWGGGGFSSSMRNTIQAAQLIGHVFVAAAGNDDENNDLVSHYPSNYNVPNIIAVAATTKFDGLWGASNFGATNVDIGAPGHQIYSTVPTSTYAYKSGTSMATPHVTGVVSLVMSRFPESTWQEVKSRVLSTARPIGALNGKTVTGGIVNAEGALGDCNGNGVFDGDELTAGTATDCNANGLLDECDISTGGSNDCNSNNLPDTCDLASGVLLDDIPFGGDGKPDSCQPFVLMPSGTHPTLQSAIDSAVNGDVVVVAEGVYRGVGNRELDFNGKDIVVTCAGEPSRCIIDCESAARGFFFADEESPLARIDGLAIVNGFAARGASVACVGGSSPTLTRCLFVGGTASSNGGGGGVDALSSSPTLKHCLIAGNTGPIGGGLASDGNSVVTLEGCAVVGNESSSFAGGAAALVGSELRLRGTTIMRNSSPIIGGGIVLLQGEASLVNSVVWGNTAPADETILMIGSAGAPAVLSVDYSNVEGGAAGVSLDAFSTLDWLTGNLGADAVADDPRFLDEPAATWGGAVTTSGDGATTTVIDPSLNGTGGPVGGGWRAGALVGKLLQPDTTRALMFPITANTRSSVTVLSDIASLVVGGGAYRIVDYHIAPDSPCIDAGDNAAIGAVGYDIDAESRVFAGGVDIGADEFLPRMVASDPPDGAVDARVPTLPNGDPAGLPSIDLFFNGLAPVYQATAGEFAIATTPGLGAAGGDIQISDVTPDAVNDKKVTMALTERMSPGQRVCVTHPLSATQTCLGFLPGDVDASGVTDTADIGSLIDGLANPAALAESSADIDRSGAINPADLLRLIDLMNGGGSLEPWFGESLPSLPLE